MEKITADIPLITILKQNWPHISTLELADPNYYQPGPIDILIGADNLAKILQSSKPIIGESTMPIALHTIFGWTIIGNAATTVSNNPKRSFCMTSNDQLQDFLTKFWIQEDVPSSSVTELSTEEAECEAHFKSTHTRDSHGRYVVRLPFLNSLSKLGDSKLTAHRCLQRLLKRLSLDPKLNEMYTKFLQEYIDLGHMQLVSVDTPEPPHAYYLPHHGVLREQSTSTKLRVVFNGSSQTSSKASLNDIFHTGPKTQNDIFNVLLWFRKDKYVFITDIVKMFRQIAVHPEDWDQQRILWIDDMKQIQAYQLKTVTYGTRSAPFLACRTLLQLVTGEGTRFPLATEPILKGSYVDDISGGAENIEQLNLIATQLSDMCKSAGLPLDKWKSNSSQFNAPEYSTASPANIHVFDDCSTKILGDSWHSSQDAFSFNGDVSFKTAITKRAILSEVSQLFDPLGFISPVVVKAKILIQQLWLEKSGWDEPLTPDIISKWSDFRDDLSQLSLLKIPRWLNLHSQATSIQLHGFSDASQLAMSAVVYLRAVFNNSETTVSFVCSKTRIAPLKRWTIPRLELSAALLLAKLVKQVQETLNLDQVPVFLWTDSSVTLAWVKNIPMRWKEFVGNRVSSIQKVQPTANWRFTSGKLNPADCASRGLTTSQLIDHNLWWTGPPWLAHSPEHWPVTTPSQVSVDLEKRPKLSVATRQVDPDLWDLILLPQVKSFHKDLSKLLRITAICQRAVARFKRGPNSSLTSSPLNPADLEVAKLFWVKQTQQAYFSVEINTIKAGGHLSKNHALAKLTARLDHQGILRVGGRLQNSLLPEESKHPLILPKSSRLSDFIIANAHSRTYHGGTQLTLAYVRQSAWILGGRVPIKSFIHRCLTCARIKGVRAQQQMGQLPSDRVSPSLVFENSGIDYAGPVTLKTFQGRGAKTFKGWIAVFVCLATSAIHLEVVSDYSAEAFIKAFRRFTSRRGICKTLRSDCGTNFKGADALLKTMFHHASQESQLIQNLLLNDGTRWIFNPPGAPHMGGKWEAAVKSMEHHLQRTIADKSMTFEDFSTLLARGSHFEFSTSQPSLRRPGRSLSIDTWPLYQRKWFKYHPGAISYSCSRTKVISFSTHSRETVTFLEPLVS